MPYLEVGEVVEIYNEVVGAQFIRVRVEGASEPTDAINYTLLTGRVDAGDRVLVNTTAVHLGLGTGGYHFVVANLTRPTVHRLEHGHIMKLRYTPHQLNVLSVDAPESPHHSVLQDADDIAGMPVIIGELHSMIAPAASGVKATAKANVRIAYVMTDSAALPLPFSHLVRQLKMTRMVDVTITAGQAFGGDVEAVNVFTALLAAKHVLNADVAIVTPGPGHLGTGTKFGFSGIEMGWIIDAVHALGGKPVFIPRVSFADPRPRHRGISHHTPTILMRVAHAPATVCFHNITGDLRETVKTQLLTHGIPDRHTVVWEDGTMGIQLARELGLPLHSMGRRYEDDPVYFLTASAAGVHTARELLKQ